MAAIYSVQIAAGTQATGTSSAVYTVPSGSVLVIRDICVGAQSAPANSVAINLSGLAEVVAFETVTQYQTAHWEGRAVAEAGQVVSVDAIAGTWTYLISGYLLSS